MQHPEADLALTSPKPKRQRLQGGQNAVEKKSLTELEPLPELIRTLELRSRCSAKHKLSADSATNSKSEIDRLKLPDPSNPSSDDSTYFLRELPVKPTPTSEDNENLVSSLNFYKKYSDGSYACELCTDEGSKNICEDKTQVVRHLLQEHTHCQTYECSSCQLTFEKFAVFEKHTETEHLNFEKHNTTFFECDRCEHRSKTNNLLRLHILRRHATEFRYVCKCCAKCFKTWKNKYDHEKTMEQIKKPLKKIVNKKTRKQYVCDKCDKVLRLKDDLIKHMKIVHSQNLNKGKKNFHDCKRCTKLFLTRKSLIKHSPICVDPSEDESTGFSCSMCDKRLSSKDHLKKHALVHSGERPHVCYECGQAFALLTTMRIHALSHHNIKPYACSICSLSYSQRSALMTHWKGKHKNLPAPGPVEIHHFFDQEGRVNIPYNYEE